MDPTRQMWEAQDGDLPQKGYSYAGCTSSLHWIQIQNQYQD